VKLSHLRLTLVTVHRWAGLFMAVFLFIAGLTGAVISWDHELDALLNPQLFSARSGESAKPLPPLALARQVEIANPHLLVSYVPLSIEAGHTLMMGVRGQISADTGKRIELGFNQVAIDPATAAMQGARQWGAVSMTRENLLPFLYKLHYSLHLPKIGEDFYLGLWVMGIIAIVWVLDCFLALWISFPNLASWRKSFAFRVGQGWPKMNFDLHRSGGVWTWLLLLMLAITSVSMNLNDAVMQPLVSVFSPLTPSPFDARKPSPDNAPIKPAFSREQILTVARAEADKRGWHLPAGAIAYADRYGTYQIGFFEPAQAHGDGGLGNPWLYFDAMTGQVIGSDVPGTGTAGDIFMQAQFPLHSGRIIGLPGRILISLMGLVVAMLSVTGIIIWVRKRRSAAKNGHAKHKRPPVQASQALHQSHDDKSALF